MATSASSSEASATTFATPPVPNSAVPDDFWVEWHPTRSVHEDVASGEWVRIPNGIGELTCSHGFERDVQRVETGTALVVFDNRNRSLDPSNPYAVNVGGFTPLRHVRIRARSGVTTRTLWRGFTVDWKPAWNIHDAWVVMEAKDSLVAAAKKLRENTLSVAIGNTAPDMWVPLDDGGTAIAQGRDAISQDAVMTGTSATGNILPFGDQASTTFPHPNFSKGDLAMAALPYSINPAGFTIVAVIKAERPDAQVILANGPNPAGGSCPSGHIALTVDVGDTYSLRVGNNSGSSLVSVPRPHADPSTLIVARYNPTNTTLWATRSYGVVEGDVYPNASFGGTWTPDGGTLRVGAGLDAANANPFLGQLSHVASWNRELTDTEAMTIISGYWGGVRNLFIGFAFADESITWVLDRLGIPLTRRDLALGTLAMGGTSNDLTALEMMSRAAATEGGYFFADRHGNYVFRLRGATATHRGTYDTRPVDSGGVNAALNDLTFAQDDRTFFTVGRSFVTTAASPQLVEYRHANADEFGEVIYEPPTQFGDRDDAMDAAVLAVGDATPELAVVEVEVAMGAVGVVPDALLASDILDQVDTVARIPGLVGPVPALLPHEQTGTIVKVTHTYYRGGWWRTRWGLVPE